MNDFIKDQVELLDDAQSYAMIRESRIVAIRWDVLPWSIVLDLDVSVSEAENSQMRRAWLAFYDVSRVNLQLSDACIPTGVFIVTEMWTDEVYINNIKLQKSTFRILVTEKPAGEISTTNEIKDIVFVSKKIAGVASINSCFGGENGLSWADRNSLASDENLRDLLLENREVRK